jgi:hypothetical protein
MTNMLVGLGCRWDGERDVHRIYSPTSAALAKDLLCTGHRLEEACVDVAPLETVRSGGRDTLFQENLPKLKVHTPHDPTIPLLSAHSIETRASVLQKGTYTRTLIAAVLRGAPNCKQSRYASTGEWIGKLQCIQTGECYTAVKKEEGTADLSMWIRLTTRTWRE